MATASLAQGKIGLGRAPLTLAVTDLLLVEALDGRPRASSPTGAGTTVTAELPCAS